MNKRIRNIAIGALILSLAAFLVPNISVVHAGFFDLPSFEDIMRSIGAFFLSLMGSLLILAGNMLNFAVTSFITEMGDLVRRLTAINSVWSTFRDFANIFFIFVILYAAVMIILSANFSWQRVLTNIVLVAIFINFSLFLTKAVVDVSNIVALQFYNATSITDPNNAGERLGIADTFMQVMRVPSVVDVRSGVILANVSSTALFMISFLLGFLAFIFFAGAILIGVRFIMLIFLMVLSPIAFVGWAIPQTSSFGTQWWRNLLKQAFFAPIFLAMLYLVASFIGDPGFQDLLFPDEFSLGEALSIIFSSATDSTVPDNVGDVITPIIAYLLSGGMLLATLVLSTRLGAAGSNVVVGWGKSIQRAGIGRIRRGGQAVTRRVTGTVKDAAKATGRGAATVAGAATAGAAGALLRNTAGKRAAAKLDDKDYVAKQSQTRSGRLQLAALEKASKASFDVRNTQVGKSLGLTTVLGKGTQKGGYSQRYEAFVKKQEALAKEVGEVNLTNDQQQAEYDYNEAKAKAGKAKAAKKRLNNAKTIADGRVTAAQAISDDDLDNIEEIKALKDAADSATGFAKTQKTAEYIKAKKDRKDKLIADAEKEQKRIVKKLAEVEVDYNNAIIERERIGETAIYQSIEQSYKDANERVDKFAESLRNQKGPLEYVAQAVNAVAPRISGSFVGKEIEVDKPARYTTAANKIRKAAQKRRDKSDIKRLEDILKVGGTGGGGISGDADDSKDS